MLPDLTTFYQELGHRIKTERLKRNISQENLGNHLDLTRASIINIENGRHRPSIYQLILIANYFQIDYTYLIPFELQKPKRKAKKISSSLDNMITDQEVTYKSTKVINNFLSSIKSQSS